VVRGDMVRMTSLQDSVVVVKPTSWTSANPGANNSIELDGGAAFVAKNGVQLYRFFNAPTWMEYRAGTVFSFGTAVTNASGIVTNNGTLTERLPDTLSADTLILETGGTLSLNGSLTAGKRLELVAGEDIILKGTVNVLAADADGLIDALRIVAR
jgi:hypothetical protein